MNQHHQNRVMPLEDERRTHAGAACVACHLGQDRAITPYCFRHQAASDMKADGQLDSGAISAALGHLSDATKSTYGHANMCKGRGVAPARVTAARAVKLRAAAKTGAFVKASK
jgi:integrase